MKQLITLLIVSIVLLYLNLTPVVRVIRGNTSSLVSPVSSVFNSFSYGITDLITTTSKISTFKNENEKLKELLALKESELIYLNSIIKDNKYVIEQKSYTDSYNTISANLIGKKELETNLFFEINKGSKHGVSQKNTVVYLGYLVGNIQSVSNDKSLVKTVLSESVKIPAESVTNGTLGTYSCIHYVCYFEKVLTNSPLDIGEKIISSGSTSDYNRGYILGTVQKIESSPENPFKKAILSKEIDLNTISKLTILLNEK